MDLNSLSSRRQVSPVGAGRAGCGRNRAAPRGMARLCDSPIERSRSAIQPAVEGGAAPGQGA